MLKQEIARQAGWGSHFGRFQAIITGFRTSSIVFTLTPRSDYIITLIFEASDSTKFAADLFAHRGQKGAENVKLKKKFVSLFLIAGSVVCLAGTVLGQTYYVQPGDSLYSIAVRYGTTVDALRQANGLGSNAIAPGQSLNIASKGKAPAGTSLYTVHAGDTLFLLSQRFGVSVSSLKQANNLSSDYLVVGRQLVIPKSTGSGTAATTYKVQSGDTLYLIARRYGVSLAALEQANGIYDSQNLRVGQTLTIPTGSGSSYGSDTTNYTVQYGDTPYLIAARKGISVDTLLRANNLGSGSAIYPGQVIKIPRVQSGGSYNYYGYNLSQSDLDLLARLVTAESGGEPYEGQVAVAATILNRLRDPRYPKTIPGIVYQVDNGVYQYSPVLEGGINQPASDSAYRAVQNALSGWDPSHGANGFYNPAKTDSQWVRSHPTTAVIGNHVFFSY